MATRDTLQARLESDRHNTVLQEQYKQERNRVKSLLRTSEQATYRDEIYDCRGNTTATWKIIKEITPNKRETNNNNFENESDMAEKFNDVFVNVGERTFQTTQNNLNDTSQSQNNPQHNVNLEHLFRLSPVDRNTVILIIKHLKKTNTAGSDGISLHCDSYKTPFKSPSHILPRS